ncbi:hypothetical protein M0805_003173 [Coniferiporia weirii]|nr:hypothetical protein M0805_003173 [Coniferiporia weirii]
MPTFLSNPTSLLRRIKKPVRTAGKALQEYVSGRGLLVESNWRARLAILVLFQVAVGLQRNYRWSENVQSDEDVYHLQRPYSTHANFVALDALRIIIGLISVFIESTCSRGYGLQSSPCSADEVNLSPIGHVPAPGDESIDNTLWSPAQDVLVSRPLRLGTFRSNLAIALLSLLLTIRSYFVLYAINSAIALNLANPISAHFTSAFVPLFSGLFMRVFFAWSFPAQQWLGIIIQVLGILSAENLNFQPDILRMSVFLTFAPALLASLSFTAVFYIYKLHNVHTPHELNVRLFAFGFATHLAALVFDNLHISSSTDSVNNSNIYLSTSFIPLLLHAIIDVVSLSTIFYRDSVMLGVATSVSTAILVAYTRCLRGSLSFSDVCGTMVSILGFLIYIAAEAERRVHVNNADKKNFSSRSRNYLICLPLLAILAYSGYTTFNSYPESYLNGLAFSQKMSRPESLESPIFADLTFLPPAPPSPSGPACTREPLPSVHYFSGERNYHEFDNVLLIVFFSHARYDANLDFYKEVYSEFFPNMVFVGPRNREDKGFSHSYDVLVDSYESEENLSDWRNYKMAGRMAHHMLYTILTAPPYSTGCYEGFLWAPFDTLLNIPRLQLFDKTRLWYFSPWAEYIPNAAISEDAWQNPSNHALPARVSPDPETDFKSTYRGWWVDWWWGDEHFGIPVCKPAFERIPLDMRTRLAHRFTHDETRYIGGSADTLYIPARLAPGFIEVLGTFLETDCFLEIAVPTAVHLIVPEGENILFVDHWWIWEPPFNASFVRDVWARGMEVDTFHTFHWGDKDADGVWKAIPENIDDIRQLFRESAVRQGIEWLPTSRQGLEAPTHPVSD